MKRTYNNGATITDLDFFVGIEVEHTPAHGKKTLFVVGAQDPVLLLDKMHNYNCEHVYLGANMSFNLDQRDLQETVDSWTNMFTALQQANVWFTLDFQPVQISIVTDACLGKYNKFIAMISVRLPDMNQLGYNACLKLDDHDFQASSNPGVWVHRLHQLQDPNVFTHWDKYTKDTPTTNI